MEVQMNQEWEKLGHDIRNIVEDAINSQNFTQLNKTITNTVNEAVNSVQKGLYTAGQAVNAAAEKQRNHQQSAFRNVSQREQEKVNLQKENQMIPLDKKKVGFISEKDICKSRRLGVDNLRLHFKCRFGNCCGSAVYGMYLFGRISYRH